jgi:4,5-DOPA dioxygenase extradiol
MADPSRLPVAYLAHGSPMIAVEPDDFTEALRRFGSSLPRPRAIVAVSAHWEAPGPVRVTAAERPAQIFDFSGFPPELYEVRYAPPGDPRLAEHAVRLLAEAGIPAVVDSRRGLDHGTWVPLRYAFPSADIPVVQVSLPASRSPADVAAIGKALGSLRDGGVLLAGSGGIVHNLRRVRFDDKRAPVDAWAAEFDGWVGERAQRLDLSGLSEYARRAPHAALAVPTSEHFDPLFFVLGAARPGDRPAVLYEGFHHGNLSMRSISLS